ncbi:olfactory receptor 2T6-like [Loxodonta africana]|uniref:olfactory receptor 2T6-like n=1 Tax=Loxodonta africana TaxID=9785 RepID=UPI0030D2EBF9
MPPAWTGWAPSLGEFRGIGLRPLFAPSAPLGPDLSRAPRLPDWDAGSRLQKQSLLPRLLQYTPAHFCLFALFTMMFLVTLIGNSLLILLILVDPHLHTPMYLFLWQLFLIDTLFTLAVVPKMLIDYLLHRTVTSVSGCGIQIFLGLGLGGTECILLGLMSYNNYVAIYKPLHYPLIMNWPFGQQIAVSSWTSGSIDALIYTVYITSFHIWGNREIHNFYCEHPGVLRLSCEDTLSYETGELISTTILLVIPFSVILASYLLILITLIQMASTEGQKKAFSTYSSHLTVSSDMIKHVGTYTLAERE